MNKFPFISTIHFRHNVKRHVTSRHVTNDTINDPKIFSHAFFHKSAIFSIRLDFMNGLHDTKITCLLQVIRSNLFIATWLANFIILFISYRKNSTCNFSGHAQKEINEDSSQDSRHRWSYCTYFLFSNKNSVF